MRDTTPSRDAGAACTSTTEVLDGARVDGVDVLGPLGRVVDRLGVRRELAREVVVLLHD